MTNGSWSAQDLGTASIPVVPASQARTELSALLDRFNEHGVLSEPMIFGRQRVAEGVVIPFELYEQLAEPIMQARSAAMIRARINDGTRRITVDELLASLAIVRAEPADGE